MAKETFSSGVPKLDTKLTEQEVLARLGRPVDLHSVDVHRYDGSRCRVNVRRELDRQAAEAYFKSQKAKEEDLRRALANIDCSFHKTTILITDSFYLRTNYDGSLRKDCEPITRRY